MLLPLVMGMEPEELVRLLLSLHPKFSDSTKKALIKHLAYGWDESTVCSTYDLRLGNFERSLETLNETNHKIELIKVIDSAHLSEKSETSLRLAS
tara:strand:- start:256 stop:540 length:285 start_codon:yes stop_codon:yes gene_type:complete